VYVHDAHVVQCVACKQNERKQQETKKLAPDKNAISSQTAAAGSTATAPASCNSGIKLLVPLSLSLSDILCGNIRYKTNRAQFLIQWR